MAMNFAMKLDRLLQAVETLGIEVRHVNLDGSGGGFCAIKGKRVLFVDADADGATQYDSAVGEIAQIPEIDQLYIIPEVREDLERARA